MSLKCLQCWVLGILTCHHEIWIELVSFSLKFHIYIYTQSPVPHTLGGWRGWLLGSTASGFETLLIPRSYEKEIRKDSPRWKAGDETTIHHGLSMKQSPGPGISWDLLRHTGGACRCRNPSAAVSAAACCHSDGCTPTASAAGRQGQPASGDTGKSSCFFCGNGKSTIYTF